MPCQDCAEPPRFPVRTLHFLGGRRSIFGEPVPKRPGMLGLVLVLPGGVMSTQNKPGKISGKEVPDHGWGYPPLSNVMLR